VVTYETGRPTTADPSSVGSRDDFVGFVEAALADLRAAGADEWENGTLERFLDGLAAVSDARVVDGDRASQETPTWRLFAELVAAATGYE
jgi:hypothetical protein